MSAISDARRLLAGDASLNPQVVIIRLLEHIDSCVLLNEPHIHPGSSVSIESECHGLADDFAQALKESARPVDPIAADYMACGERIVNYFDTTPHCGGTGMPLCPFCGRFKAQRVEGRCLHLPLAVVGLLEPGDPMKQSPTRPREQRVKVCPKCFLVSESTAAACTDACGHKFRNVIDRICENPNCKVAFKAKAADVARGWGRFCSRRCKAVEQESRTHATRNYLQEQKR